MFRHAPRPLVRFALPLSLALICTTIHNTHADQITLNDAQVFPNERTSGNLPPEAIDGNLSTFTWSTQSGNSVPARLAVAFDSQQVNRIRLWKDDDDGTGSVNVNAKDLTIQFTTDTNPDLSLRNWTTVGSLRTGFNGEFLNANSVNSDGTVIADVHDSVNDGDGWASLVFSTVEATGVAILVEHTGSNSGPLHYKVHELEAHIAAHGNVAHLVIDVRHGV